MRTLSRFGMWWNVIFYNSPRFLLLKRSGYCSIQFPNFLFQPVSVSRCVERWTADRYENWWEHNIHSELRLVFPSSISLNLVKLLETILSFFGCRACASVFNIINYDELGRKGGSAGTILYEYGIKKCLMQYMASAIQHAVGCCWNPEPEVISWTKQNFIWKKDQ